MLQSIFTLTIIKTHTKKDKTFKITLLRKLISPLNDKPNMIYLSDLFHCQTKRLQFRLERN